MGSRTGRGKLLLDMSTGKITIKKSDEFSSDPFKSAAYDPTRGNDQNQSTTHRSSSDLITVPEKCDDTYNHEAAYLPDDTLRSKEMDNSLNFRFNRNSISSDATICAEDLFAQDETVTSNSPSIIILENLLIEEGHKIDTEEFKHEQSCEVSGCKKEVFSACHKCLILQCWDHFIDDTPCLNHNKKKLNSKLYSFPENTKFCDIDESNINDSKKIVQQLDFENSDYILDENTGWLVEKRQEQTETNPTKTDNNVILDDQTGEIIEITQANIPLNTSHVSKKKKEHTIEPKESKVNHI